MRVKKPLLGVKLTGGVEGTMTPWAGISPLIILERKCGLVEPGQKVFAREGLRQWVAFRPDAGMFCVNERLRWPMYQAGRQRRRT